MEIDATSDLWSKAFKRADVNVHGKLKLNFLKYFPHYSIPGFNLSKTPWIDNWNIEDAIGLHQVFPYNCDLPKPLLPPVKINKNFLNRGDPALNLITTKTHIESDTKRILDQYRKHHKAFSAVPSKKDVEWTKDGTCETSILPRYAADLAKIIDMDPDPYFTGMYNWYYTGGCLETLQFDGKDVLIFPYMNDLVATPVESMKNSLWKANLPTAAGCRLDEKIYEIRSSVQHNSCRILGRSKNSCTFFSLGENNGNLRLFPVHKKQSRVPYISSDLDPTNFNRFCTMDLERTLTLWDMVSCKRINSNKIDVSKVLEDQWGSVKFMETDPDTIIFTDRCCVHYLDTRVPYHKPVLTLCPKANLETCESLCLAVSSCSEDKIYLGAYHSFFMCDRRSSPSSIEQTWTHQFKSPPLFAAVRTRDDKEVIVLSSQISGETSIILNTWNDRGNTYSYNIPHRPPTISDTLRECHMQGKCLDPSLRKRMSLCTSGISIMNDKEDDLTLFFQNSIGDVFYQCITHAESLDKFSMVNCESYCIMEAWEKQLLRQERLVAPLVMTNRINMHRPFENLKKNSAFLKPDSQADDSFIDPKWKQSLEELKTFVDILAPELLAVWEVSDEIVPTSQPVPHQKVLNWLEMADERLESSCIEDSQGIVNFTATPVNTQDMFSVSQQPKYEDFSQDVAIDSYFPPVKVNSKKKPQAKKLQSYVAGF